MVGGSHARSSPVMLRLCAAHRSCSSSLCSTMGLPQLFVCQLLPRLYWDWRLTTRPTKARFIAARWKRCPPDSSRRRGYWSEGSPRPVAWLGSDGVPSSPRAEEQTHWHTRLRLDGGLGAYLSVA